MGTGFVSLLVCAALSASAAGCAEEDGQTQGPTATQRQGAVTHYAALVYASYQESAARVDALKAAIDAFLDAPSAQTHQAAKDAWNSAREVYGQTEGFRFYGGPIDSEDGPEGRINAWPLDENFIDYTRAGAGLEVQMTGIINDPAAYPEITAEALIEHNTATGDKNVSLGFHAVEFLLWGQDFNADGPGDRAYTDYLTGADATAPNGDRRAQYLRVATEQLRADLQEVLAAWAPDVAGNYRAQMSAEDPSAALRKVFQGIGTLSGAELSQERAFTAYAEQDQEQEHSCFSDTTHRDMLANALSIQNIFEGRAGTFDDATRFIGPEAGTSLYALISAADPALAERIRAELQAAVDAAKAIPAPFDRAILPDNPEGRAKLLAFVESLEEATKGLVAGAAALGIKDLNTELPE